VVALWITPTTAWSLPVCVRMFEPCAVSVVVNVDDRNAMPMPVPPLVLPADGMPAPPATVVN
jgi:hypothetical protein